MTLLLFDLLLLIGDLMMMMFDLRLLLFEGVDEYGGELTVFDAFDLAFVIAKREQRLYLLYFLRAKPNVFLPALLPREADGSQSIDDLKPCCERLNTGLVSEA